MDTVLRALTRNRLSSETDPNPVGDPETGKHRMPSENGTLSSTSDCEQFDDNGEVISTYIVEQDQLKQIEDEERKRNVSIDCTKALVIFGFSNWSELEPGKRSLFFL